MKKEPFFYLKHISSSIHKIKIYTEGLSEEDFLINTLLQDAVIRNLEVIGEATKKLDTKFRMKYPDIEWKKIAGMRDKLIHDYMGVDLWAVWGVVENIIPQFHIQIEEIIKNEEGHF